MSRRDFLSRAAMGAGAASAALTGLPAGAIAGPFTAQDAGDHFVPADKKLGAEWIRSLFARGERTWYSGDDLRTIGMPVGGIGAGQLYLLGDGRLGIWDIFNQNMNSGYGQVNYQVGRDPMVMVREVRKLVPVPEVEQGFALRVESGGETGVRTLDRSGFPTVRFCGEYPIGYVEYRDPEFPVAVTLEAFSPFIPLNAADSALPATILRYSLANTSSGEVRVTLAGYLQNAVCRHSGRDYGDRLRLANRVVEEDGLTAVLSSARLLEPARAVRPPVVFADFEGGTYGEWTVEGGAPGERPPGGTLEGQQRVSGFRGKGLVNTFLGGDEPRGKLTSPTFRIERPWISFLVGGGSHEGATCMNLLVEDRVVRTATGKDNERLVPHNWNVEDLRGRQARLEIVDAASGPWGHINVDQIEFRDEPMTGEVGDLRSRSDHGTLALALLGAGEVSASAALPAGAPAETVLSGARLAASTEAERSFREGIRGAVARTLTLRAGESVTVSFAVAWCMPNLRRGSDVVGNYYSKRFGNALEVARYLASDLDRLARQTILWHDTYYDSTLPRWLLDRLHSTVGNLASATCQWWRNGRFWAWEGVGCCHGTCGHVWNYEHAMARLFPELERSVREMQDFAPGVGFNPETGSIGFRGEGWTLWAGDSQGGYVLKAYREHLVSPDDGFLRRNWKAIRLATRFLIEQDQNDDGLIEGAQHQTYDQNYHGPNTMVGSLYLGALRAAEEMAREVGDAEFAARCRKIFDSGRERSVERLFNGEYFIQDVDLEKYPKWQYGDGCLSDQLFGQGWAHQVGLGYVYPRETVASALRSIWKYCWAPDVRRQNEAHPPERWFAYPGEAGLFTCTWPKSRHLGQESTRYRNEIWTGIEYQVAGHMAWEGLVTEALAMCRAIHERYHPAKHNPWNEIECGDHYARALASWGVLTALGGFHHHGPGGQIGFAPRITPEAFRSVFTAAEGWGHLDQRRHSDSQTSRVEVAHGRLKARVLLLELPEGVTLESARVRLAGRPVEAKAVQDGTRLTLTLEGTKTIEAGETVEARLRWRV